MKFGRYLDSTAPELAAKFQCVVILTHWPLGDLKEIGKSNLKLILMIGRWGIFCKIALEWMSMDLTDDKSILVQVMAWCRQAASHYLSQCWPRSMSPNGVTWPQWGNDQTHGFKIWRDLRIWCLMRMGFLRFSLHVNKYWYYKGDIASLLSHWSFISFVLNKQYDVYWCTGYIELQKKMLQIWTFFLKFSPSKHACNPRTCGMRVAVCLTVCVACFPATSSQ